MRDPVSRQDRLLAALLLVAACFAAYGNGLTGTFTYDDKAIIRDNARIRTPQKVGELFTTPYFGGRRGTGTNFRPILLLSYAVQWWVHGKNAFAFHFVNVVFHCGATLLLGSLLLRIGIPPPAAALSTLFFAVDPIHVEAVTSLVGRGETQTALFVLAFLHLGLGFARASTGRALRLAGSALVFALAISSKESAAVAPPLLFLLLAYVEPGPLVAKLRAAFVRGLPIYGVAALVLAGYAALRAWVIGGVFRASTTGIFEVENPLAPLPAGARAVQAIPVLFRYLGRIVFPLHLSADESAWSISSPSRALSWMAVAAAALFAAVLVLAAVRFSSGSPSPVALGILFFATAFVTTANVFVPFGTIFGERIAYLPSAGICLALGAVLAGGAQSFAALSRPRRFAAGAVALMFAARTVTRNAVWWSDSSVFANSARVAPRSAKSHYNEGYLLSATGELALALRHYSRAVEIYRGYWDAWAGKGRVEKELGRFRDAEKSYGEALRVFPEYENGFYGLGLVHEAEGRLDAAAATYRSGLAKIPDSLPLAYRLALVLGRSRDPGARSAWVRAVRINPRSAAVHGDFAAFLLDTGDGDAAEKQAREALALDRFSAPALRTLSRLSEARSEPLAAALALERAVRASGSLEDLAVLERIARQDPEYGARFQRVRAGFRRLPAKPPGAR